MYVSARECVNRARGVSGGGGAKEAAHNFGGLNFAPLELRKKYTACVCKYK